MELKKEPKTGLLYREGKTDLFIIKEQNSYNPLLDMLCKNAIVLDIGGNIGAFAHHAINKGAKQVYSFEPEKDNIEIYKKQKLSSILIEKAVSNKDGTANFYVNEKKNTGIHSLQITNGRKCTQVETISFEKILKKIEPDIVKIDIEGGEYNLDFDLLKKYNVKGLALELHLLHKPLFREQAKNIMKILKTDFVEVYKSKEHKLMGTLVYLGRLKNA